MRIGEKLLVGSEGGQEENWFGTREQKWEFSSTGNDYNFVLCSWHAGIWCNLFEFGNVFEGSLIRDRSNELLADGC
jgi:hypothetical protein